MNYLPMGPTEIIEPFPRFFSIRTIESSESCFESIGYSCSHNHNLACPDVVISMKAVMR